MTTQAEPAPSRRRLLPRPSSARTRIIGWVLLLVLAALAVVTFVTWRLLIQGIDERVDASLRAEVGEFAALTESGSTRPPAGGSRP
ncbi:hypothetical protein [Pseudonocardia acidicola]|uniref:Two-component sensor histidine kinase n=1 Tax=Pseudonocardia acidicola TaxID=2724939 RepID=A0ABX1SDX5_9PSEU|nr:hypothetical protein [Pseudonocardia acidicola]NMH98551.1 hypothetical protein [Pseudonocardia acidicola]